MTRSLKALQVIPPVVRDIGNGFEIDVDFVKALEIYLETFERFTVACPVRTGDIGGMGLDKCLPVAELPWGPDRFRFIPLPLVYSPVAFLRRLPATRALLAREIDAADRLIFTPYSLIGDWPTVAVREAIRRGRRYTIEADGVHSDVTRKRFTSPVAWKRLVQTKVLYPLMDRSIDHCMRRSALGIFQGRDVFDAYAPVCPRPVNLNHHIPVYRGDHIGDDQLAAKIADAMTGRPLRICYAGRAIDMKGPLDWIETLGELSRRGIDVHAEWLGDGPMLGDMIARAGQLGLRHVELNGFVGDREQMLAAIRDADVFMFCHNTLESARILGEALACGTPLVGFGSAYPKDLVAVHGGGEFVAVHDVSGLADLIEMLSRDRERLARLIAGAARSGREFDRDRSLRERAEMIAQLEDAG